MSESVDSAEKRIRKIYPDVIIQMGMMGWGVFAPNGKALAIACPTLSIALKRAANNLPPSPLKGKADE